MNQPYEVTAKCHMKIDDRRYRVKVSFPNTPMRINGFTVFSPNEKYPDWYVSPPTHPTKSDGHKPIIEFTKKDGENEFWLTVRDACLQATHDYIAWQKQLEDIKPMY